MPHHHEQKNPGLAISRECYSLYNDRSPFSCTSGTRQGCQRYNQYPILVHFLLSLLIFDSSLSLLQSFPPVCRKSGTKMVCSSLIYHSGLLHTNRLFLFADPCCHPALKNLLLL